MCRTALCGELGKFQREIGTACIFVADCRVRLIGPQPKRWVTARQRTHAPCLAGRSGSCPLGVARRFARHQRGLSLWDIPHGPPVRRHAPATARACACYRRGDATATCARIGGEACPTVSAYNLCTSQSECGPYATCSAYSDGRAICSRRCATDNDCPAPPGTSVGIFRRCDTGGGRCYLRCNGPGVCPFGLSCFRFADGTFGYCN